MAGKIATFSFDADTPLSTDEQAMLVRLAAMPDSGIDYSDIPPSPPNAKSKLGSETGVRF